MAESKSKQTDAAPPAPKNPTPFIDATTALKAYNDSNKWLRPYFEPIEELERIARNKPSPRIPANLPKITDGTTSAIIQEDPKRIIQQLATGILECEDWEEYAKIADIVHRDVILPNYSRMGTALQKHWNMMSKALTWGRSTSYTFFTNTNGVFHTDFIIPYVKDIITEKGKVYAPDCNYLFMRSWYQDSDLKAIIDREKWMEANIKGYKSDWDLKLLADLRETSPGAKPAELQTPAEREKGGDGGGHEVIHAFQRGIGAEFYSFAPRFKEGEVLRTKVNKDPRGEMPFNHEYCNIDLSNPLGRGSVELSGGVQNLMDQKLQMYQFMTTLMMAPPLQTWGNVDKNKLKFKPNAIWDMGSGPNNKVEPYEVNNAAIASFTGDMQFLQSKIYNLNSSQDNSIPADSGNVGQSKTQAGVKAQDARLGVSDNYLRKQHETWYAEQAETSVNIFFAEMTGSRTMKISKEDARDLMKLPNGKKYLEEDGRTMKIPYKDISDVSFKFKVDASSSEVKEDADNADKLAQALTLIQTSEDQQVRAAEVKVTKLLLDEIGAEGTDDLFPEDTDEEGNPVQGGANPMAAMQQMMPQIQEMVAQMIQEAQKQKPETKLGDRVTWKPEDLKPEERAQALQQMGIQPDTSPSPTPAQFVKANEMSVEQQKLSHDQTLALHQAASSHVTSQEQGQQAAGEAMNQAQQPSGLHEPDEDEGQIINALLQRGFSEDDVEQAIIMLRNGMELEQIIPALGAKYAQR